MTPHEETCMNEVQMGVSKEVAQEVKVLEEKLADAVADKEELTQRCHELGMQVIN